MPRHRQSEYPSGRREHVLLHIVPKPKDLTLEEAARQVGVEHRQRMELEKLHQEIARMICGPAAEGARKSLGNQGDYDG